MPLVQIKTIESDIFQKLEGLANDFLATTPGLSAIKIICDDFIILANGNQIHNFTCLYGIRGEDLQPQRIKLLMRDNVIDLEAAINAALITLGEANNCDFIQRFDAILDNGNKYYCCCITYQAVDYPNTPATVKIIEKDNIGALEKAVNDYLTYLNSIPKDLVLDMILRQEIILANGNKIYTCTIIYGTSK